MPIATKTTNRRKKQRQSSESDIEQDNGTQRTKGHDDIDDDDDSLARPVKHEKGKKKAKTEEQHTPPEEDDDDDVIDIDNFPAQPLTRADCQKLKGLSDDWNNVSGTLHGVSDMLGSTGSALVDSESDELEESLAQLDHLMRDFIDVGAMITSHGKALNDIAQGVFRGEEITDVKDRYLQLIDAANAKYDANTSRQKYAKNEDYTSFKQAVWEAQKPGEAMPPITVLVDHEDGDDSDDDDDIVIGGATQDFKCPLMMTTLNDPYTSTVCKHSFSRNAITEFFNNSSRAKKCPTAGCSKEFTLAQCRPNPQLAKKIKDQERRIRMQQQASDDDDEVIE
ncbi:zinc-finger of the MIZ type in Nse subunit-domain-containing protein [Mycena amicta]|nr:zinc-finger of the MIZ type in Nse subunit-domain-containing protein [Mycena amicta]